MVLSELIDEKHFAKELLTGSSVFKENFYEGVGEEKSKLAWVSWDKAVLEKWRWRIMKEKNNLWYRVLTEKYGDSNRERTQNKRNAQWERWADGQEGHESGALGGGESDLQMRKLGRLPSPPPPPVLSRPIHPLPRRTPTPPISIVRHF
ncbi:hypothetical protein CR513_22106, partial [Mucuna pruriens]